MNVYSVKRMNVYPPETYGEYLDYSGAFERMQELRNQYKKENYMHLTYPRLYPAYDFEISVASVGDNVPYNPPVISPSDEE